MPHNFHVHSSDAAGLDLQQDLFRDEKDDLILSRHNELRLLFLDVDGVLNCLNHHDENLVAHKVELIAHVVEEVNTSVSCSVSL